ncbi:hypothetical protein CsSME_00053567 [Camellia sinensis var. sinensis]
MGDHMVFCVDHLVKPESLHSLQGDEVSGSSGEGSCSHTIDSSTSIDIKDVVEHGGDDEQEPLIQAVECRICQEEDSIQNMEFPCACSGSLKVSSFDVFRCQFCALACTMCFVFTYIYCLSLTNFLLVLTVLCVNSSMGMITINSCMVQTIIWSSFFGVWMHIQVLELFTIFIWFTFNLP